MRQQVSAYNELVKQYHALDEEIDTLLSSYGGYTENMTDSAMQTYRALARKRDDVFNQMRTMERILFADGNE